MSKRTKEWQQISYSPNFPYFDTLVLCKSICFYWTPYNCRCIDLMLVSVLSNDILGLTRIDESGVSGLLWKFLLPICVFDEIRNINDDNKWRLFQFRVNLTLMVRDTWLTWLHNQKKTKPGFHSTSLFSIIYCHAFQVWLYYCHKCNRLLATQTEVYLRAICLFK